MATDSQAQAEYEFKASSQHPRTSRVGMSQDMEDQNEVYSVIVCTSV